MRQSICALIILFYCNFGTVHSFSTSSPTPFSTTTEVRKQQNNNSNSKQGKDNENTCSDAMSIKPRILCLHGKFQSGAILSNKIAGARRKLARIYDLDFLDAPIELSTATIDDSNDDDMENSNNGEKQYAWWIRNDANENIKVQEALDYVIEYASDKKFDAILGFSQGGTLATALALSGKIPNIQAIVTAGSPFVSEAYDEALQMNADLVECTAATNHESKTTTTTSSSSISNGLDIPKLHFAGETDTMVPVDSTRKLCEVGGNGELIVHEKGHLFPTKAVHTNYMIEFLNKHVKTVASTEK